MSTRTEILAEAGRHGWLVTDDGTWSTTYERAPQLPADSNLVKFAAHMGWELREEIRIVWNGQDGELGVNSATWRTPAQQAATDGRFIGRQASVSNRDFNKRKTVLGWFGGSWFAGE